MDTSELMAGIAVVIDDAFADASNHTGSETDETESIFQIVEWFEKEWKILFVKEGSIPLDSSWPNLLGAASFVLLDWRFWKIGADQVKKNRIKKIKEFLTVARKNLVPVFILTNEKPIDVLDELRKMPEEVYDESSASSNFVFVEEKSKFWSGTSVDLERLKEWVYKNASIYTLKTWQRVLEEAKSELFDAMCLRSVDWPRVFWETYQLDRVDPSTSLMNLINDSLRGRMRINAFENEHLGGASNNVSGDDVRRLIVETSFRGNNRLSVDEVRGGDLFCGENGEYWLNVRADCDCIPRGHTNVGNIDIYCIRGNKLSNEEESELFIDKFGNFNEYVSNSIVFGVAEENGECKSIQFRFKTLRVFKYSELRDKRVGRLLHPYITRVQQRYALYLQRQALPRIPVGVLK